MIQERLEFDNQIDILEKSIRQRRKNLKDLAIMCNDAQIARDMAKVYWILKLYLVILFTFRLNSVDKNKLAVKLVRSEKKYLANTRNKLMKRRNLQNELNEGLVYSNNYYYNYHIFFSFITCQWRMMLLRVIYCFNPLRCSDVCILIAAEVQISIGGQDQEAKISSYEDALSKIKDTTGVSDIQVRIYLVRIVKN